MPDIFEKLYNLNSLLQGPKVTILDVTDKVLAFIRKICIWNCEVQEMDLERSAT